MGKKNHKALILQCHKYLYVYAFIYLHAQQKFEHQLHTKHDGALKCDKTSSLLSYIIFYYQMFSFSQPSEFYMEHLNFLFLKLWTNNVFGTVMMQRSNINKEDTALQDVIVKVPSLTKILWFTEYRTPKDEQEYNIASLFEIVWRNSFIWR